MRLKFLFPVVVFIATMPDAAHCVWWDGSPIHSIDGTIEAVIEFNGDIIVAGYFTQINGISFNSIALWNGDNFVDMDRGMGYEGNNGKVKELYVFKGELLAGGVFDEAGQVQTMGIARWDGYQWKDVGGGIGPLQDELPAVNAFHEYRGKLVVGGHFDEIGRIQANNVAQWNGVYWSNLGNGTPELVNCFVEYQGALIAGGTISHPDPIIGNAVWSWNDSGWHSVSSEGVGLQVNSLIVYDNQLIAGGAFFFSGDGLASLSGDLGKQYAWWDEYAGGVQTGSYIYPWVRDMEIFNGDLIVAGRFDSADGDSSLPLKNVARWDGIDWSDLEWGLVYSFNEQITYVYDVFMGEDHFFTVGNFTKGGDDYRVTRGIALWMDQEIVRRSEKALQIPHVNGHATWVFEWRTTEFTDPLFDVVTVRDDAFTTPSCMIGEQVFVHNCTSVVATVIPNSDDTYLHMLTVARRECAPGCDYLFNVSSTVDNLTVESVDNRWNTGPCIMEVRQASTSDSPGALRDYLTQNQPNPFNPTTTISYSIASDSRVNLAVYDVRGKPVRTLVNEFQPKAFYGVTWDGKDDAGNSVATGTYFYRLTTDTYSQTQKMVLLK